MPKFFDSIKYSTAQKRSLLLFYYLLIPIIGIFLVLGYIVKINKHIIEKNKGGFPYFGSFKTNFIAGIDLFLFIIINLIFSSLIVLLTYSIGFLINSSFAKVFSYIAIFTLIIIYPMIFLSFFSEKQNLFSIESYLQKKIILLIKKNPILYIKTFFIDVAEKLIIIFFPALFIITTFYFYGINNPTGYDLAAMIISLLGLAMSLFVSMPILILNIFTNYSLLYSQISEEE
jgi:hypothetical protein